MSQINFMTIGSDRFYSFINFSTRQLLKLYPKSKFYIYDWGMKPNHKEILRKHPNTELIEWFEKLDWENGYQKITEEFIGFFPPIDTLEQRKKEYLFSQKPVCMLDCAKRIKENLIFLDGDAFIINRIDDVFKLDFDIGVTVRSEDELINSKKLGIIGAINVGVLFFKMSSERLQNFLEEWIKKIESSRRIWVEQTTLTIMIEKENINIFDKQFCQGIINTTGETFKIQTFPCEIYNLYRLKDKFEKNKVKILHFKGRTARKKIKQIIAEIKMNYFLPKLLKIFPTFIRRIIYNIIVPKVIIEFYAKPKKIKSIMDYIVRNLRINKVSISLKRLKIQLSIN